MKVASQLIPAGLSVDKSFAIVNLWWRCAPCARSSSHATISFRRQIQKGVAPKQIQCSQNLFCVSILSWPQPVTIHERALLMAAFAIENSSNNICAIHPASLTCSLSLLNSTHDVAHCNVLPLAACLRMYLHTLNVILLIPRDWDLHHNEFFIKGCLLLD